MGLRKREAGELKSPAFQFYPKDWLADADVQTWGLAERGAYITLICYIWENDGIPNDEKYIKRLLGNPRNFPKVWSKVKNKLHFDGEMVYQTRLMIEQKKQEENRASRRAAGKIGAKKRWQTHSNAMILPMAKNGSSSSSSTATAEEGENPPSPALQFWLKFKNLKPPLNPIEEPTGHERGIMKRALDFMPLKDWIPYIDEMHKRGKTKELKFFVDGDFRQFEPGKKGKTKLEDFKTDTTGHYIGFCTSCGESSFYDKFHVWGDSSCCESKIAPERIVA